MSTWTDLYWGAVSSVLRLFFTLLYGPLAWTYDTVAAVVSLNNWRDWVLSPLPYLAGPRVLELGHGPGHLLTTLRSKGLQAVGIDISQQMGILAFARQEKGLVQPLLVNGYAQLLPFSTAAFDEVVATFPTEYIWERETLKAVWRVLKPGGMLLTLPVARITGEKPLHKAARWLFHITGQAPESLEGAFIEQIEHQLKDSGFRVDFFHEHLPDSTVVIIRARKPES